MRNTLILSLATVGLAGCMGPGADAVWLFTEGETTFGATEFTCQENFETTECPEPGEDPESDWTYERDTSASPGAFFGQILDGPSGEKVLVVDGEVFVGEKSGGIWRFEWVEEEITDSTDTHVSGYSYSRQQTTKITTVFALDLSGGTAIGDMVVEREDVFEAKESDVWVSEEVGRTYGSIFDGIPFGLAGDNVNYSLDEDCTAGDCQIVISGKSTMTTPITAMRTDAGRDGYEGVQHAGQDPGTD